MELARNLPIDQAVTISENVLGAPLLQLCFGLDPLLLLGLPLVVFGLCRAGVLGWWTLASVVAGTVLLPFSPTSNNLVVAVAFVLIQLPLAAGRRAARSPGPACATEHPPRRRPPLRGTASSPSSAGGPPHPAAAEHVEVHVVAPTARPAARCW